MTKFIYDDVVTVHTAPSHFPNPGAKGWVIAVFPDRASRPGSAFEKFPDGPVYTIEFEDGSTAEVHESWLQPSQ